MTNKTPQLTIILRHRKENLKKCTLHGLESRKDMQFYSYPNDRLPPLSNYILLTLDAPPLSSKDRDHGLFIIDGTWRYAAVMEKQIPDKSSFILRSIPNEFRTAYPRKQTGCPDSERGLASLEALFIAHVILGKETEGLLSHYYFGKEFLEKNQISLLKKSLDHQHNTISDSSS